MLEKLLLYVASITQNIFLGRNIIKILLVVACEVVNLPS